jgi:hypothetical protein
MIGKFSQRRGSHWEKFIYCEARSTERQLRGSRRPKPRASWGRPASIDATQARAMKAQGLGASHRRCQRFVGCMPRAREHRFVGSIASLSLPMCRIFEGFEHGPVACRTIFSRRPIFNGERGQSLACKHGIEPEARKNLRSEPLRLAK